MKLVVIGYLGDKRVYVDVPVEEAISRYTDSEDVSPRECDIKVVTVNGDEFRAYDIFEGT